MEADSVGEVPDSAPQAGYEGHTRAVEDARFDGEAIFFLQEKNKDCAGAAREISNK